MVEKDSRFLNPYVLKKECEKSFVELENYAVMGLTVLNPIKKYIKYLEENGSPPVVDENTAALLERIAELERDVAELEDNVEWYDMELEGSQDDIELYKYEEDQLYKEITKKNAYIEKIQNLTNELFSREDILPYIDDFLQNMQGAMVKYSGEEPWRK